MSQRVPLERIGAFESEASDGVLMSYSGCRHLFFITDADVDAMFTEIRLEEGATPVLPYRFFLRWDAPRV
jgi:hypothetical protein